MVMIARLVKVIIESGDMLKYFKVTFSYNDTTLNCHQTGRMFGIHKYVGKLIPQFSLYLLN